MPSFCGFTLSSWKNISFPGVPIDLWFFFSELIAALGVSCLEEVWPFSDLIGDIVVE